MELTKAIEILNDSDPNDWSSLDSEKYYHWHAFKKDVSFALGWALKDIECEREFESTWTDSFPDKKAFLCHLDFYYNGTLFYQLPMVSVDGCRMYIPLPDDVFDETGTKVIGMQLTWDKFVMGDRINRMNLHHSNYSQERLTRIGINILQHN